MPIRTRDGLVHEVVKHETKEQFGKTKCGRSYTRDPGLIATFSKPDEQGKPAYDYPGSATRAVVTCLGCLGG